MNSIERAVVGSVLQDGSTFMLCAELNEDDFEDLFARIIFSAEKSLFETGSSIDIVTVGHCIESKTGDSVNAKELLLSAMEPTSANLKTYVKKLKEQSARRKIRDLAMSLYERAKREDEPVDGLIESFRTDLNSIVTGASDWMSMQEMSMRGFNWLEQRNNGSLSFIPSGISAIDRLIGGFYPNELTVLAARPAVGKSALGLFIALNAARSGKRVAMVSREMSPEAIFQRAISNFHPSLRGERLRKDKLEQEEWEAVADAIGEMSRIPLSTIYTVRNVESLKRQAMNLKDRSGLDFLIVDYAQLMHTTSKTSSRVDELEIVSGSLKELAMDLQIPVLTLAQVRRSGNRTPVMPTMDELKGTGAFEQDADGILLMHRCETENDEFVYPPDKKLFKRITEMGNQYIAVNIAKQRQGQVGIVNLVFDPSHMSYRCISRAQQP